MPADKSDSIQPDLRQLAAVIAAAHDLASLTRPLLAIMQQLTGMEITYLTLIDEAADEVVVAYTSPAGGLCIPEGVSAPWRETLCRRSLVEDRRYVADASVVWADMDVVAHTGIRTYLSVAVRDAEGRLVGTLCGASRAAVCVDERDLAVTDAFAQLIAAQLAREAAHSAALARAAALEQRLATLRESAERDPLTGLSNRAGIRRWLRDALDALGRGGHQLVVAFIDLDGFKQINDTHGHAVGDEVLHAVARSLSDAGRHGDLYGRLGGDEFVVAALLPPAVDVDAWHHRVQAATRIDVAGVRAGGSVGVVALTAATATVDDLLHDADQAMYAVKTRHRNEHLPVKR